jgi:hypothetical protein
MRPKCENCGLEDLETGSCGHLLMPDEFKINIEAKKLLMSTGLTGFCEYHIPREGMIEQIDYSFTEQEVAVW